MEANTQPNEARSCGQSAPEAAAPDANEKYEEKFQAVKDASGTPLERGGGTTPLHVFQCAACGTLCYSPEANAKQTIFWDQASRTVRCSDHSDVVAGTPARPRLQERWRFKR